MKRGKRNICLLLAVLTAGVVLLTGAAAPAVSVQTERVRGGQLIRSVPVQATVCRAMEEAYLSPKSGKVTKVFVKKGQHVREGELLFQLDVSEEEKALAALYQKRYAYEQAASRLDEKLYSLSFSQELEWYKAEQQLLTAVGLSCVRSRTDGVVSDVYVGEGETVVQGSMLGSGGSEQLQFVVAADKQALPELEEGMAAILRSEECDIPVVVAQVNTNAEEHPMGNVMCFEPASFGELADYQPGMNVQMELIYGTLEAKAIMPFEAIDAEGNAWYIQDGKAISEPVKFETNNRTHAVVSDAWCGREVILYPDGADLTDGVRVRVER